MRGLWFLLWRDTLGQGRLLWRRLRGWRAVSGILFFTLLIGGAFALTRNLPDPPSMGAAREEVRRFAPLGLLVLVALGAVAPRGLYFRPSEVAWLFPAPLRRSELVLFNVLSRARMALLSAAWLAAFPSLRGRNVSTTLLGYLLSMLLLQMSAQWFAVLRVWLVAHQRARRAVRLGGLTAIAGAGLLCLRSGVAALEPILLLTRPFVEVVSAESLAVGLLWAAPCVALLGLLLFGLCTLEVDYVEAAMERSHGAREQRARMRSEGGVFAGGTPSRRARLPRFPRLRGAGPLAWRQCMDVIRNPRGVVLVLLVVMSGAGGVVLLPHLGADTAKLPPAMLPAIGVGMVFMASLMSGDNLAFDFRRDLDRMDVLKALPISPFAIAAGQIAAATLFVCGIQLVGIVAIALGTGVYPPASALWFLLLLPPANWSAIAIDNAFFLLMPYRTVTDDPGDVGFMGRMMLSIVLKFGIVATLLGVAGGFAFAAHRLSGGSLSAAALAALGLFVAACVPLTQLVAWTFRRFDVARDTPA
jgi:hypothetical protein